MNDRGELGKRGEALAAAFLQARECRILARNFRCRSGEIDLVVLDGDTLVFVEVRSRRGDRAGSALESVTPRKQQQVARVAQVFLAQRGWTDRPARFDVVGIQFDEDPPAVEHLRGAFDVAG